MEDLELSSTMWKLVDMQLYTMYILTLVGLLLVLVGGFAKNKIKNYQDYEQEKKKSTGD